MRDEESDHEFVVGGAVAVGVGEAVKDASEVFWEFVCKGGFVGEGGEDASSL